MPEPPIKTIFCGRITVAIWNNTRPSGRAFLTARISKDYMDKDGTWQQSHSFSKGELENVKQAINETIQFMEERVEE